MKYLKPYNESAKNFLDINTLDGTIVDIFSELTDIGYSIEVLHQNGYATYNMLPPVTEHRQAMDLLDRVSGSNKNLQDKKVVDSFNGYANLLANVSKCLPEISSQMSNIPGIKDFYITMNGRIEVSVNHKPQGYGNLGSVMLVGPPERSVYR